MKLYEIPSNSPDKIRIQKECILCSKPLQFAKGLMHLAEKHRFILQIFFVLLYRIILDVTYLNIISPLYAYAKFTTNLHPVYYGCTLLVIILFAPFVARLQEERTASSALLTVIHYIYFIPFTSYCGCYGASAEFFLVGIAYWVILLLFQYKIPVLLLSPLSSKHISKIYNALTIFAVVFTMFISGRYTGFRFTLDFLDVYGIRAEAATYQIPGILAYALSMTGILLALLMLYWLNRKKYLIVVGLFIVYLFFFSISALKSIFFFGLLLIACHFFYRTWMLRWIGGLMSLFTSASILEYVLLKSYFLSGVFIRRMMYIPLQIAETAANFFAENPLNLFRFGIMSKFSFEPIYSMDIPVLVAEAAGEVSSANTGLLGDMYENLPTLLGILLMPLIIIICFRVLDAVSHRLPAKIVFPICIYYAANFTNASWSAVLLTHGFILACILLYLFSSKEISQ